MPSNREVFIEVYKTVVRNRNPLISDSLLNDCVHGCLIAVNSNAGLSDETMAAALALGIEPRTDENIMKYVFTPADETDDDTEDSDT